MEKRMTTIWVSRETWTRLNSMKELGDTMDDIIKRIMDIALNMKG